MILPPPDPPPIIGRASVIDGDTIEIHGQRIRLWGIDAPESRQTCTRAGETYRCGQQAANALSEMLGDRVVTCTPRGRPDRYRRVVARCTIRVGSMTRNGQPIPGQAGSSDIARTMVIRGLAMDYSRYSSGAYADDQRVAERTRAGLWAGEFQMPWEWRAR